MKASNLNTFWHVRWLGHFSWSSCGICKIKWCLKATMKLMVEMHKHFSTSRGEWCISYCVSSLLIEDSNESFNTHLNVVKFLFCIPKKMGVLNNWWLNRHPCLRWQWKVMPKLPWAFLILSTSYSMENCYDSNWGHTWIL